MNLLGTVAVVSLYQHDLLGDFAALCYSAETDNCTSARVRLLITMSYTHTSTDGDVEASELALLISDCDETNVIGKDVDVVEWWDGNSNFELQTILATRMKKHLNV